MSGKNLFIVIAAFDRWPQTHTCLTHLLSGTDTGFEIIVVDHGRDESTRAGLAAGFPRVVRLAGTPDMWWTAATNAGIREALRRGADTVMLLNNDCYADSGMIMTLKQHQETAGEVIIAPVQRSLQSGAILTRRMTTCLLLGFTTLVQPGRSLYRPREHRLFRTALIVGGRGVMIPSGILEKVGLLNEVDLPHYGADHDFYLRCRKHGVWLYIASDALLDVDEETTSISTRLGNLSAKDFLRTLGDRHSHRNIRELTALFRLHYPIPGLYLLGVVLNLVRYTGVYLFARIANLARR
jgi:GT2 family glycosyltransferase